MNNVSKIIIIIIIIIIIKEKYKSQVGGDGGEEKGACRGDILFILLFIFFVSFSDLRKSDRRFSSGLKVKLIYAMRATRGHQNL